MEKTTVQKVQGTHKVQEAEGGEWLLGRIRNWNADRAQLCSKPSLAESNKLKPRCKSNLTGYLLTFASLYKYNLVKDAPAHLHAKAR